MNLQKTILTSKESLTSFLIVLLLLILENKGNLYAQAMNIPRPSDSLYLRAPDTIPGTLPEMRDPSYWIARMKNPDKIVMSLGEIQGKNIEYYQRLDNLAQLDSNLRKRITWELESRPGLIPSLPDLKSKTPFELYAITHNMIDNEINFLRRGHFGNILGIEYSAKELNIIEDEMAFTKTSSQNEPYDLMIEMQLGITVGDSRLRIIPSIRFEYIGNTTFSHWDMWNYDIVPIGSQVQILHTSKTGGFLFVLSDKGFGWINSEEVALCSNDDIDKFINSKNYIICTGDRVPYYSDSNCTYVSGWFRMGDRLPIKGNDQRLIQIPMRQVNGKLLIQDAWLKSNADINSGYLPYTRRNVVVQAFKLLDNLYDWTGAWYGRDHATTLRDIFSCFGFKFPSNGVLLSAYNDKIRIVYPEEGKESQLNAISGNEPFLTIQICSSGHSQLYLGNYKGVPIVFDTHGYSYTDKNGNELVIRRCNVGTLSLPDYFLKQNITFVELK